MMKRCSEGLEPAGSLARACPLHSRSGIFSRLFRRRLVVIDDLAAMSLVLVLVGTVAHALCRLLTDPMLEGESDPAVRKEPRSCRLRPFLRPAPVVLEAVLALGHERSLG